MRSLWLALWFAVLGWDALLPHVGSPAPRLGLGALVVAGVLFSSPNRRTSAWFSRGVGLALALACGAAAALLPYPERLGLIILGAGGLVLAVPLLPERVRGPLWRGAGGLGATLAAFAVTSHVYRVVEGDWYRLSLLAHPAAWLYRLLGIQAAADAPFVHVHEVGTTLSLDSSVGAVAGHPLALFAVGGLAMLAVIQGASLGWKRPLKFLICAAGFSLVRGALFGLALAEDPGPSVLWLRGWGVGGLLALAVLLTFVLPPASERSEARAQREGGAAWRELFGGRRARVLVAAALLGALSAAALGFYDPGAPKQGRILIDEKHSNWAWSTVELNTESYGTQTVYNYSEMLRYLGYFYEIAPTFTSITDSLLSTADVMVLKTPTRPYEDAEVDALVRFVERGGGLWLIGDHTNIFGMSTNLNKVAGRFGIRYRYDAVIDVVAGGRQLYERPRMFAHPSITHLPPLLMATSASVEGPPLGRRVMLGRSLLSDELDYSVNTFFGNFAQDGDEPFGSMLQAVAVTRGRGRVLAFSDSTIFSNFFFFVKGKSELALGSVAWLMSENRWAWARPLLAVAALAGLLFWLSAVWSHHRASGLASLAVGAAPAFAIVAALLGIWVSGWSVLPDPGEQFSKVAFMRERCAFHIPEKSNLPDESPHSFHTFYIWTQRVGYVPRTDALADCLEDSEITVIINPRGEFTAEMLEGLETYVREGGGLLILDRPYAEESTANAVLEQFGLEFEPGEVDSTNVFDTVTADSLLLRRVGAVSGGEPVLLLPDGRAAMVAAKIGEGAVVALPAADNFSDAALGTTSQVPDENQLKLYRLQFRIFGEMLKPMGQEGADSAEE